jgi:hypothetical protein
MPISDLQAYQDMLQRFGGLGAATSNPLMERQVSRARGAFERPQAAQGVRGALDFAAGVTMPIPIIGDVLGFSSDVARMRAEPEERTAVNMGLAALGLIPFVPQGAGRFMAKAGDSSGSGFGPVTRQQLFDAYLQEEEKFPTYADRVKALRQTAKQAYSQNKAVLDNAHKNENLTFYALPPDSESLRDFVGASSIYKSPVYNNKQSSEYFVGVVNGEPAYIRKSNHWGKFHTNIKEGSEEALRRGLLPDANNPDPFGRVGRKEYQWTLVGGNESAKNSQAGYIPISELLKLNQP